MNLLAKSCFAPGLISLISNLIASASSKKNQEQDPEWLQEYMRGMGHEIYRVQIYEQDFQGPFTFIAMANLIYEEHNAVAFALEIEQRGAQKSIIRLNPSNFDFTDWQNYYYYIYMICEDEAVAKKVQKMEN